MMYPLPFRLGAPLPGLHQAATLFHPVLQQDLRVLSLARIQLQNLILLVTLAPRPRQALILPSSKALLG
jgi:hypothetical protein